MMLWLWKVKTPVSLYSNHQTVVRTAFKTQFLTEANFSLVEINFIRQCSPLTEKYPQRDEPRPVVISLEGQLETSIQPLSGMNNSEYHHQPITPKLGEFKLRYLNCFCLVNKF